MAYLLRLLLLFSVSSRLLAIEAAPLELHWTGKQLSILVSPVHFLSGRPLEQLRNGAEVTYDFQLAVYNQAKTAILARAVERFVVSYDIWGERFSAIQTRTGRAVSEPVPAPELEDVCLLRLSLPTETLNSFTPYRAQLQIRSSRRGEEGRPAAPLIATLVGIFSRPAQTEQPLWVSDSGPFRLIDLRRVP